MSAITTTVIPSKSVTLLGKRVLICLPWYKSTNPITSMCVTMLADSRRTALIMHHGDAFVVHSRNSCADAFLKTDMDYMLFIDDDMVVPCGNAEFFNNNTGFGFPAEYAGMNAIDRLLSHKKTLVGGLYFGRNPNNAPPVYNEGACNPAETAFARKSPQNICKPTKWVGTGCMLIHRSVFEDIEKKFPRLARGPLKVGGQWFTSTEASVMAQLQNLRDQLQEGPLDGNKAYKAMTGLESILAYAKAENNLGYGEDVSFCIRAATAGHQPFVDFGLVCGHIGMQVYGPRNTATPGLKSL